MKERFTENGIEYVRNGDYYIPNLSVPDDKAYNIGKYGNNAMPWREIKTMRNIAAHNYGEIDIDILWETATCDIPDLKEYCKKFIV